MHDDLYCKEFDGRTIAVVEILQTKAREQKMVTVRRAAAALITKYGIAKNRLTPVGLSFAAPVASNKTEEGRAKNRRVELVEN